MRLIDADEFAKDINKCLMYGNTAFTDKYEVLHRLNNAPTIEAESVRHGKWIENNDFHWIVNTCSKCGYQRKTDIKANGWNGWNYCPHCGAKMNLKEVEE